MEDKENECCECGELYSNDEGVMIKEEQMSKAAGSLVNIMTCPKCGCDRAYDVD